MTPTLWWMAGGSAHSAKLPQMTLPPYSSRSLDVLSIVSAASLESFNGSLNLEFDTRGKTGGLLLAAGSVDQTNTYVFEVIPHGTLESAGRSMPYWSTGNGDDTMVTLWNPADEAQDLAFKVFFTGGHYSLPVRLEPRTTRTFNMSEIIQNQVPDSEGNLIPASVHEGSAKILGGHDDREQILVAMDSGIYNVRKAVCNSNNCQTCDGATGFWETVSSFVLAIGRQTQQTATEQWSSGTQYNITNNSTWSSDHTNIATVQAGLTHGVGAGSANVHFQESNVPIYAANVCYVGCPITSLIGASAPGTVAQVSVTSVAPSPLVLGGSGVLTIGGSGFQSFPGQPTVSFDGGGITVSNPTVVNGSTITATYQVTCSTSVGSQNLTVSFAGVDGGSGAASNAWPVSVTLPQPAAPSILLGGQSISGTQSVVVGQQIALSASPSAPSCTSISSQQWSIPPGTAVGGYAASTSSGSVTALPSNAASSYTFYWVYPGNSLNMTYQYSISGGGSSVNSPVATATFNVAGPSGGTMTSTPYSHLTIASLSSCVRNGQTVPAGPWLVYGSLTGDCLNQSGSPGISFGTPTGYSNSSGGSFLVVQLVASDALTGSFSATHSGLDFSYPYPGSPPPTNDAPLTQLLPTYTTLSRSFDATMFLMWQSASTPSIPVPLGYQRWSFSGSANCNVSCGSASNWTATTNGTPGLVGGFTASNASQTSVGTLILLDGYPTWTGTSQ